MSDTVNIDEIAGNYRQPPIGRFTAKLLSAEAKLSKAEKPKIEALFEITEGEHEGAEVVIHYSLFVTIKDGKKRAGGILDLKRTFAAVGTPLPSNFNMPCATEHTPQDEGLQNADKVRKLFIKNLTGKKLELETIIDKSRPAANPDYVNTKSFIRGLVTRGEAASKASSDILDDLDE